MVQKHGDDILLCKSCIQRCSIFKTNGPQELNQSKQFLCHHHGARYHNVIMRLQALGRSVETRISWSIRGGSPCRILHPMPCIQLVHVVFSAAVEPALDRSFIVCHPYLQVGDMRIPETRARSLSLSIYICRRRQRWRRYRRALQALFARCIRGHTALLAGPENSIPGEDLAATRIMHTFSLD